MFRLHRLVLGLLLLHLVAVVTAHVVFLGGEGSQPGSDPTETDQQAFSRSLKRATWRGGIEERCSWEEAREIFEDVDKTNDFWAKYVDGDACLSHPCAHQGLCKDGIGTYSCYCQAGYQGFNCEIVIPELCENRNGGCEHFCSVARGNVECSCAAGYFLASDDKS
ncbi:hypothetical protein EPR50_G00243910 [Perca flavescens]|uniref:coagulation factor Xa n=1 Tax=Perca flavescens TaxID=8167 RepID=A0A484BXW7_PERFV|nr:hypothetical protein EPR50_G00243910 [Perca flavescens]